jgi:hypothetical protein
MNILVKIFRLFRPLRKQKITHVLRQHEIESEARYQQLQANGYEFHWFKIQNVPKKKREGWREFYIWQDKLTRTIFMDQKESVIFMCKKNSGRLG